MTFRSFRSVQFPTIPAIRQMSEGIEPKREKSDICRGMQGNVLGGGGERETTSLLGKQWQITYF